MMGGIEWCKWSLILEKNLHMRRFRLIQSACSRIIMRNTFGRNLEIVMRRNFILGLFLVNVPLLCYVYYRLNLVNYAWYNHSHRSTLHCSTPRNDMKNLIKLAKDLHSILAALNVTHWLAYGRFASRHVWLLFFFDVPIRFQEWNCLVLCAWAKLMLEKTVQLRVSILQRHSKLYISSSSRHTIPRGRLVHVVACFTYNIRKYFDTAMYIETKYKVYFGEIISLTWSDFEITLGC